MSVIEIVKAKKILLAIISNLLDLVDFWIALTSGETFLPLNHTCENCSEKQ